MDDAVQDESSLVLGGNIKLTGFRDVDRASMVVVKKVVGNYVKRLSSMTEKFENIDVVLKPVHAQGENMKFELRAKMLDNGKVYNSDVVDKNLFFALDHVLSRIEGALIKNR